MIELHATMHGPEVLNLEKVVIGLGFDNVPTQGVFDVKLENVIKYIQKSHGLREDGIVGAQTYALLDKLYQPNVPNFSDSNFIPESDHAAVIEAPTGLLTKVHPTEAEKIEQVVSLAKSEGFSVVVTQGLRTFAEQHKLYTQKPKVTNADAGHSYHNYGVACDIAFVVDGKITWEESLYKNNIGRWATKVGLEWGGHWHFIDYPHLQLPNMEPISSLLKVYNANPSDPIGQVWKQCVK